MLDGSSTHHQSSSVQCRYHFRFRSGGAVMRPHRSDSSAPPSSLTVLGSERDRPSVERDTRRRHPSGPHSGAAETQANAGHHRSDVDSYSAGVTTGSVWQFADPRYRSLHHPHENPRSAVYEGAGRASGWGDLRPSMSHGTAGPHPDVHTGAMHHEVRRAAWRGDVQPDWRHGRDVRLGDSPKSHASSSMTVEIGTRSQTRPVDVHVRRERFGNPILDGLARDDGFAREELRLPPISVGSALDDPYLRGDARVVDGVSHEDDSRRLAERDREEGGVRRGRAENLFGGHYEHAPIRVTWPFELGPSPAGSRPVNPSPPRPWGVDATRDSALATQRHSPTYPSHARPREMSAHPSSFEPNPHHAARSQYGGKPDQDHISRPDLRRATLAEVSIAPPAVWPRPSAASASSHSEPVLSPSRLPLAHFPLRPYPDPLRTATPYDLSTQSYLREALPGAGARYDPRRDSFPSHPDTGLQARERTRRASYEPTTRPESTAQPHRVSRRTEYGSRQPISCYPCRVRKLRCNGVKPCEPCVRRASETECDFAPAVRRRGKARAQSSNADAAVDVSFEVDEGEAPGDGGAGAG